MSKEGWTQEEIDAQMSDCDDGECGNCGGEGYVYSCVEEWACADPEGGCDYCRRRCDWCRPPKRDPALGQILSDALAKVKPQ